MQNKKDRNKWRGRRQFYLLTFNVQIAWLTEITKYMEHDFNVTCDHTIEVNVTSALRFLTEYVGRFYKI